MVWRIDSGGTWWGGKGRATQKARNGADTPCYARLRGLSMHHTALESVVFAQQARADRAVRADGADGAEHVVPLSALYAPYALYALSPPP